VALRAAMLLSVWTSSDVAQQRLHKEQQRMGGGNCEPSSLQMVTTLPSSNLHPGYHCPRPQLEHLLGVGPWKSSLPIGQENPLNADALKPTTGRVSFTMLILETEGRSGQLCWWGNMIRGITTIELSIRDNPAYFELSPAFEKLEDAS